MPDFFDDLIPQQQAAPLNGFDDLIPQSQFSNVQSGAESAAVPEKPWYEEAYDAVAEAPGAAYEGLQAGSAELGKWATLAGSVPAMAYDSAKSALIGETSTEAQDWMFGNLVQPYDETAQQSRAEVAKNGLFGQVVGGVAQAVPDVALALAGGGPATALRSAAPLVETGAQTLMRMLSETAMTGVKQAAPLAEKAAGQAYGQAIAEGKSAPQATGDAIKAIATTTAMGLTGSGGVGRLGNTVASGLSGEVVREMEGRPFDPAELGTNLALGFGLSGPKQESVQARQLSPRDRALGEAPTPDAIPEVRQPTADAEWDAIRAETWGGFSDLVPEGTPDALGEATRAPQDTGATTPALQDGQPLAAVQEAPELSSAALRIKEANEQSLAETGKPLTADRVRELRDQEPTESFDLWEDTVAELNLPKAKEVRSKESVLSELQTEFGKDFGALEAAMESGKFKILDGTQLPDWVKAKGLKVAPRGWRDADGNVAIVADNLEPGYVRPLIFHEIGVHAGIQQSPNFSRTLASVHRLVEQNNADAVRAVGRVQGQKSAGNKLSSAKENNELVAYFVQNVAERMQSGESLTSRAKATYGKIKADVKNMVANQFGLDINLTDKDMYYMALGEIRKFGKTKAKPGEPEFQVGGSATNQDTAQPTATPDTNIVPAWKRKLASVFSWKGGNRFANEYERAKLEAATGDFLAQRSADLFDKAGFKKLPDAEKETVRAALNGDKGAEANLSPKAREAVRFTRDEITNYQSQLASQGVTMDGRDLSDMLYDSMAKDDYVTRAYGVYEIKPTTFEQVQYALSGAEKEGKPFWRWRQEKRNPETVRIVADFIEKNLIDPDSKRTPQEQTEDLLNQLADPSGFTGSNLEVVKQAARDSSVLMSRNNVPKAIREYWGQFTDPRLQAAFTLSRLGSLTAKQGMLNRIYKANAGKLFFEEGQQPKGFTAKLPDNHDYGPLAGKMTRPDVAREIETMTGIEKATPDKVEREIGAALWDKYVQLASTAKVAKTVFSAATSAVNAMANGFLVSKIAVQHGLMGKSLGIPDFYKATETVARDFVDKLSPENAKLLISNGIIRDSAQYGELKKIRSKIQREADREGSGTVKRGVQKTTDVGKGVLTKIADLYQIPDNFTRAAYFFGEMTIQKSLHPDWSEQKIIEFSANRARDQVPTWGRAAPAVKFTSKAAGNFATWSAEVIRSTKNQVRDGLHDLVHGETAAEKYYGAAQLIGTSAYIGMAQAAVPAAISALFGFKTDDEKKNEAVSKIAPEYFGGDTLAVASADPKSGKIVFLNSTRLDPSAPFHQLLNRELAALKEDKSTPAATWGWIKDSFLTPGPLPQGASAAITGENKFGQKLAPDERVKAVVDAFKPGTLVTKSKIDKLKKRGVDPRVIQAASVGLPLYDFDTKRAMYYSAMDFNNSLKDYRQQFNRGYGAAEATPEQQKSKYTEFLRNEKEAFDKLSGQIKSLKTIFGEKEGLSLAMESLKGAKIDKDYMKALEDGEFRPNNLEDSKTFLDTQRSNAVYNDPTREKEIRKDFQERKNQLGVLRRNYQQLLKD